MFKNILESNFKNDGRLLNRITFSKSTVQLICLIFVVYRIVSGI